MTLTSNKILTAWCYIRYVGILAAIAIVIIAACCSLSHPCDAKLDAKGAHDQRLKEERQKRQKEGKSRPNDYDIHRDKPVPKKGEKRIS